MDEGIGSGVCPWLQTLLLQGNSRYRLQNLGIILALVEDFKKIFSSQ